ncbi:MAG TPA: hypothetical protein VFW02_11260 [Candidatus Limnocylindrales bacterium]|nr:hypothetical protein [Candidatus Limnocylindrales bacterium]
MSMLQMLVLAVAAMAGLAILRVARVQAGRDPLPEARRLFYLLFIVVPPVVLAALVDGEAGAIGGLAALPIYGLMLAGLAILMWVVSLIVPRVAPGRSRARLLVALTGSEGDPEDVPYDPPVTSRLAESVALVTRANDAFPRGPEFPAQVERDGFRPAWDALDTAIQRLEGQIVDDHRLGLAVASSALRVARDARSRLDTLRRIASDSGQSWATDRPLATA